MPLSVIIMQLVGGPITDEGYLPYIMGYTFLVPAVLLLLPRFFCGEKTSVLNLKPSTRWKNILGGLGLVAITLTMKFGLDPMIACSFLKVKEI